MKPDSLSLLASRGPMTVLLLINFFCHHVVPAILSCMVCACTKLTRLLEN
jgi:hypothetical protein